MHGNRLKKEKGATLTEIIVVILVITILGAVFSGIVIFLVQLYMYGPRQLDTAKVAEEASYAVIEGNQDFRGIRYARTPLDASATQFSYTYGYPTSDEGISVRFRWDPLDKHIYRSSSTDGGSSWSQETVIPYYISSSITIDGKATPSVIFSYKKAGDADWVSGSDSLSEIRRVILNITVKSGSGSFSEFQGAVDLLASAEIKSF
ncbi:MAG: hypothetical protein AB1481_03015 [Candidatus Omnitrophota bacterium]